MNSLDEIEKLARDHKPVPEASSPADLCFYWTMRGVYDSFRSKKLNRDEAKAAKGQAQIMHGTFSMALDGALNACREREKAIKVVGSLRTELHKAKTLDEKYRIALKAISAMTCETVTEKMEVKWLESNEQKNARAERQESRG